MVRIKLCGIRTAEALDAAIAARADYVGLNFVVNSPRFVEIEQAAALAERARGQIKIVGLFVDSPNDYIDKVRSTVTLDIIQLHGSERPAQVSQIRQRHGLEVWKAIGIRQRGDFAEARKFVGSADRILYDAKPPSGSVLTGGTGLQIDWTLFAGLTHQMRWILAGGLNSSNVAEAVRQTKTEVVDTSSGIETAPGIKDPALIAAFCAAARAP